MMAGRSRKIVLLLLIGILFSGGLTLLPARLALASCGCRCTPGVCPGDIVIDFMAKAIATARKIAKAAYYAFDEAQQILIQQTIQDIPVAKTQTELAAMSWKAQLTNHETNTDYRRDQANIVAKDAGDYFTPSGFVRTLCLNDHIGAVATAMEGFQYSLARQILNSFMAIGRGGQDSNGPRYINLLNAMTCGINEGDPVTGNPLDERGEDCTGTAKYIDLNQSARSVAFGLAILEQPDTSVKTVAGHEFNVAQASNDRQRNWIAAMDYAQRAIGNHPSPPRGNELKTAEGLRKEAHFAHVMAGQTEAWWVLADRIAYLTRPNCNDATSETYCDIGKQACKEAKKAGVVIPEDYDDCETALSAYEVDSLNVAKCSGNKSKVEDLAEAVFISQEQLRYDLLCNKLQDQFVQFLVFKDMLFSMAMNSLHEGQPSWVAMK